MSKSNRNHEQQGENERAILSIFSRGRKIFEYTNAPLELWPYVLINVIYSLNTMLPRKYDAEQVINAPYAKIFPRPFNYNLLKPFGCDVWILVDREKRQQQKTKFDSRSFPGFYLSPAPSYKGWWVYNSLYKAVEVVSITTKIVEDSFVRMSKYAPHKSDNRMYEEFSKIGIRIGGDEAYRNGQVSDLDSNTNVYTERVDSTDLTGIKDNIIERLPERQSKPNTKLSERENRLKEKDHLDKDINLEKKALERATNTFDYDATVGDENTRTLVQDIIGIGDFVSNDDSIGNRDQAEIIDENNH